MTKVPKLVSGLAMAEVPHRRNRSAADKMSVIIIYLYKESYLNNQKSASFQDESCCLSLCLEMLYILNTAAHLSIVLYYFHLHSDLSSGAFP